MAEELGELRKDIKDISIQLAVLTQKISDMVLHQPPCGHLEKHITDMHKNTLAKKITEKAFSTLVTIVVVALLGALYIGLKQNFLQ